MLVTKQARFRHYKKDHQMNVLKRTVPHKEAAHASRVRRVILLITFMQKWRTVKECANHLEVSTRSVHRYFNLLTNFGFIVEMKRRDPFYRLTYRLTNTIEVFKVE